MKSTDLDVTEELLGLADPQYKSFICPLVPTVDPERMIGVRWPLLRKIAARIQKTDECRRFLETIPHRCYDEDNLHAILVSELVDYDDTVRRLQMFLPNVDNWATCDLIRPKVFHKEENRERLLGEIREWISSKHEYTVRFAIEMLMIHYLDHDFRPEHLAWVCDVRREEYYIRMMVSWYFATALAKQPDAAVPYLEQGRLERWTHNKTIQKAIESSRISKDMKQYLKTLRVRSCSTE